MNWTKWIRKVPSAFKSNAWACLGFSNKDGTKEMGMTHGICHVILQPWGFISCTTEVTLNHLCWTTNQHGAHVGWHDYKTVENAKTQVSDIVLTSFHGHSLGTAGSHPQSLTQRSELCWVKQNCRTAWMSQAVDSCVTMRAHYLTDNWQLLSHVQMTSNCTAIHTFASWTRLQYKDFTLSGACNICLMTMSVSQSAS